MRKLFKERIEKLLTANFLIEETESAIVYLTKEDNQKLFLELSPKEEKISNIKCLECSHVKGNYKIVEGLSAVPLKSNERRGKVYIKIKTNKDVYFPDSFIVFFWSDDKIIAELFPWSLAAKELRRLQYRHNYDEQILHLVQSGFVMDWFAFIEDTHEIEPYKSGVDRYTEDQLFEKFGIILP